MSFVPRVACINDLSGYGRCSLTTAVPILSVLGVQACPVPTAVLSKHTGFSEYFFEDLTDKLVPYLDNWSDIAFDGIYSGFLGSLAQIAIVEGFIRKCKLVQKVPSLVVIDTVMGDEGKLYSTYTPEMCGQIKKLVPLADLITPNITEACLLTDTAYEGEDIQILKAKELTLKLEQMGSKSVVITGLRKDNSILNLTFDKGTFSIDEVHRNGCTFSGTGDIFASIVCAYLVKNQPLAYGVKAAGKFISEATKFTLDSDTPRSEGVLFEPLLKKLGE